MKTRIAYSLVVLLSLALPSYSQTGEPFDYAYVVVTFSCAKTGKNIAVFSQVFGACYQETNHSEIASGQRHTYEQAAKASCGGDVSFSGQRTSYQHRGTRAQDQANYERGKDVRESVGYGYKVESVVLQTPSSSKCGN